HGMLVDVKDGKPCYAYGGDFGEQPHDGCFCVDALLYPDRTPHVGALEMKQVYAPVRVAWADEAEGVIRVENRYAFRTLHGVRADVKDGKPCYAYGGDFGEQPHDGCFCVDALLYPDRTPHVGALEMKQVYAPVRVAWADEAEGVIRVENRYAFRTLDGVRA